MSTKGRKQSPEHIYNKAQSKRARGDGISKLKKCPRCGLLKNRRRSFRRRANGYSSSPCIKCERLDRLGHYKKNPQKYAAAYWRGKLRWEYGINETIYNEMLAAQGGVCAICKRTCARYPRLSVDHCHKTKRVRGLLCNQCNRALGLWRDNPEMLLRAIAYLATAQEVSH